MDEQSSFVPEWVDGKKINEARFCREFLKDHPMIAVDGVFFCTEGRIDDESKLKRDILEKIEPYTTSGLSRKVQNILDALRLMCYSEPLPIQTDRIHVANGTLFLGGTFREEKEFCMNRLPVSYNHDAPKPEKWLSFLEQRVAMVDSLLVSIIPEMQERLRKEDNAHGRADQSGS